MPQSQRSQLSTTSDLPDISLDNLLDTVISAVSCDDDLAFALLHARNGEDSTSTIDVPTNPWLSSCEVATSAVSSDVVTFVEKVYFMVTTSERRLVCWNATGMGFFILDTDAFARDVLPEYFKHLTLKAFVRELTRVGFHKTVRRHKTRAIECLEFRHRHFVRGDVRQLAHISCIVSGHRASSDANEETDIMSLKNEISMLKGDVQQTQDLFDTLLVVLMQQHAAETMHAQDHAQQSDTQPPSLSPSASVDLRSQRI